MIFDPIAYQNVIDSENFTNDNIKTELLMREHEERFEIAHGYPDMEHDLESQLAMNKIDVLKQVVNDPDYVGKKELFDSVSPQKMSVQEQKAQALNKLAAVRRSTDILKTIQSKLGKDDSLKKYLIDSLSRSGSDVGEFYAQEIASSSSKTPTGIG